MVDWKSAISIEICSVSQQPYLAFLPAVPLTECVCVEGIAFYRALLEAGVPATCRERTTQLHHNVISGEISLRERLLAVTLSGEVYGTMHSSELNHPMAVPDIALATARALADFTANENGAAVTRMGMPVAFLAAKL